MFHSEESLAKLNPELAAQWHPTKNGILTPFDVSNRSSDSVWWKCSLGGKNGQIDHHFPV